jgi:hypothetical protein
MITHITGWDAKLAGVARRALHHVRGEERKRVPVTVLRGKESLDSSTD